MIQYNLSELSCLKQIQAKKRVVIDYVKYLIVFHSLSIRNKESFNFGGNDTALPIWPILVSTVVSALAHTRLAHGPHYCTL